MDTSALVVIWGSLLTAIALIVGGAYFGGPWGHAALAGGVILAILWGGFVLWLITDI